MDLRPIYYYVKLAVFAVLSICFACSDDEMDGDNTMPSYVLNSPIDGSSFESDEKIPFSIEISDASTIVSYNVVIRNTLTDGRAFLKSEFNSTKTVLIEFEESFQVPVATVFNIELEAIDDFDNKLDKVIGSFTINRQSGGTLDLRFDLKYGNEAFKLFEEYDYPSGEKITFGRLSFYTSDINLVASDGTMIQQLNVDYIDMSRHLENPNLQGTPFSYKIGGVDPGIFEALRFNIGLTSEQNATKPFQYSVTDPLGFSSEHWESWESYVFFKIEGKLDKDGDGFFESDVALHGGSDEALRVIEIQSSLDIQDGVDTQINMTFDLKQVFEPEGGAIYDIQADPLIHDLDQLDQVISLADNIKNSIN